MKNDIKFEKIHSNKKNIFFFVGIVCVVVLLITLVLTNSFAKYRSTASIPIVNSEVNYVRPDLDVVALYIDGVQASELDSSKNYTLDTTNSTCTYKDGSSIDNLTLSYDGETGSLSISPFTTRGTKCTLYFEEEELIKDTLLSYYPTVRTRTNFNSTVTDTTTGVIYKSVNESQYDNDGEVYYFAGNPTDNWVYFSGFYWRIIRINGDGTIRMIYQGSSANTTGTETQIGTSAFNNSADRSEYVGLKYTVGSQYGTDTNSTILEALNTWYYNNIAGKEFETFIDLDAGFCGDRDMASGSTWVSQTQTNASIFYSAYERLDINKSPIFICNNNANLYTASISNNGNKSLMYPIGLITADEVAFAGGVNNINNTSYYLYTASEYWTMTPYFSNVDPGSFVIRSNGTLFNFWGLNSQYGGVRPVINLKSTTTISSGNGTADSPFVIN